MKDQGDFTGFWGWLGIMDVTTQERRMFGQRMDDGAPCCTLLLSRPASLNFISKGFWSGRQVKDPEAFTGYESVDVA